MTGPKHFGRGKKSAGIHVGTLRSKRWFPWHESTGSCKDSQFDQFLSPLHAVGSHVCYLIGKFLQQPDRYSQPLQASSLEQKLSLVLTSLSTLSTQAFIQVAWTVFPSSSLPSRPYPTLMYSAGKVRFSHARASSPFPLTWSTEVLECLEAGSTQGIAWIDFLIYTGPEIIKNLVSTFCFMFQFCIISLHPRLPS